MREQIRQWCGKTRAFLRAKGGNVAMMFGLTMIPIALAAGAGVDLARAMAVKASMADALDSAALAVGATPGLSVSGAQALAQQYFNANFKPDSSADVVPAINVAINGQSVTISASDNMPTTVLKAAGAALGSSSLQNINVVASTTVVWGQTKLWVGLVLDNTGSMCEPDNNPCPGDNNTNIKINALKTAAHQLLTTLKSVATNPGDVRVSIVPFAKDVNMGASTYVSDTSIDWTDWASLPSYSAPSSTVVVGSNCPISDGCVTAPGSTTSTSKVPASGMICPNAVSSSNNGQAGHYYGGCWDTETKVMGPSSSASCTGYSNCSCTGSGSSKTCTAKGIHVWTVNAHSLWNGCVMDRGPSTTPTSSQTNDESDITPAPGDITTLFEAENSQSCPAATVTTLKDPTVSGDWTTLNSQIDAMTAAGGTNQTIGLAHGMQTLVSGSPYSPPALPAGTTRFIILLSDGLNTMDRWYGNGSSQSTSVDSRMAAACVNAKAQGIVIYTIFVDLNGTQGNSTVLQNCATDSTKYFDLTTSGGIITTFAAIAQQITSLRVSQ